MGNEGTKRLENFIGGLLEIPELKEDTVGGLISGYVDNLVQGNEEALSKMEEQLEEMGGHIVETVVTDAQLVEAAITQAQEKWKEIVNQRLLESAQEEGFKSYYQLLENALKEGDGG